MEKELKKVFTQIKDENHWGDSDSVSGTGSNLLQTKVIRQAIPLLLHEYHIKHLIDAPCGDFYWMKEILPELENALKKYQGVDIVEDVIKNNTSKYSTAKISFTLADITTDILPTADLILTRDCLVHLSFSNINKVIKNYKKAGIKYLLTTTFTSRSKNIDIKNGGWRPLNLEMAPFNFPKPIFLINENCTENNGIYADKCLGLWKLSDIKYPSNINLLVQKIINFK